METILNKQKALRLPMILTEEQQMLKDSAREFFREKSPISALRKLRDEADATGFDPALWREMAELGYASLTIPEAYGGLAFGYVGLGQVLEESGRTLAASPLVSTVLLGATAIQLGGSDAQKEAHLPAIASGEALISLALEEGSQHKPTDISLRARKTADGFNLNGTKQFVLDGHVAHTFIVAARTSGDTDSGAGISLFLVDAASEGVQVKRSLMVDSRNAAQLTFKEVEVAASALLGEWDNGYALLENVLDIGRIGIAAEMLGSIQEAFDRTVAYLKERKQFGTPIGAFQALQHRAAQMYCEIELCKSAVLKALQAIDQGAPTLPVLASIAKAKVSETIERVTNEGVQMFGGIGMTDDEEIGFFLKRGRVAQHTLGDYRFHLDRFAKLNGY